jgi:hypothetical protein
MSLLENRKFLVASEMNLTRPSNPNDDDQEADETDKRASLEQLTEINHRIVRATEKIKKFQNSAPVAVEQQHNLRSDITKSVFKPTGDIGPMQVKLNRAEDIMTRSKINAQSNHRSPIRNTVLRLPSNTNLENNEFATKLNRVEKLKSNSPQKPATKLESKSVKSTMMADIMSNSANPAKSIADDYWKKANKVAEKVGYVPLDNGGRTSQRAQVVKSVIKK